MDEEREEQVGDGDNRQGGGFFCWFEPVRMQLSGKGQALRYLAFVFILL